MKGIFLHRFMLWLLVLLAIPLAPARADTEFEQAFDSTFGTELRVPRAYGSVAGDPTFQLAAMLADGRNGRIGVAAVDLSTGREFSVLGNQRFPLASTSKIAIAATFLEGVDQGRWSLTSEFPLLVPVRSERFSSPVAPVRQGEYMSAQQLIELMISRSSNPATDALLAVVGGPEAVNDWVRRAGITDFTLSRDIATLVRDDGEYDPAVHVDLRDSATPQAMVQLLAGLYQGRWLSPSSRAVLLGAMERTTTGARRIRAGLPQGVLVAHKTGSLNNTSSDIGLITAPDGRTIALAIYVTGQGSRANREARIASITRAVYESFVHSGTTLADAAGSDASAGGRVLLNAN